MLIQDSSCLKILQIYFICTFSLISTTVIFTNDKWIKTSLFIANVGFDNKDSFQLWKQTKHFDKSFNLIMIIIYILVKLGNSGSELPVTT